MAQTRSKVRTKRKQDNMEPSGREEPTIQIKTLDKTTMTIPSSLARMSNAWAAMLDCPKDDIPFETTEKHSRITAPRVSKHKIKIQKINVQKHKQSNDLLLGIFIFFL